MDPHSFIARAEAQRWLGIAEKLLMSHDLVGAKTFAIRARESDPRLEAADQILAVADTLLAAEKRVVGSSGTQQPDYYAILQLVRFVEDTEHVADQYRRLAVTLNPHQNRFPYSDQAFQLVNDAWAVLSNPLRKSMYDGELDFPHQQEMNHIGFNLEQHHHHNEQHQHQQHEQQYQHNFFSINRMGSSGHEQELAEQQPTFQTRVQRSHQHHNFLSQPYPVSPSPVREQEEHLFQQREQEELFQPQVQPFQITSTPQQQSRPPPQPSQLQPLMRSPTPPPPAASPQPPLSWPQPPPPSQPQPLMRSTTSLPPPPAASQPPLSWPQPPPHSQPQPPIRSMTPPLPPAAPPQPPVSWPQAPPHSQPQPSYPEPQSQPPQHQHVQPQTKLEPQRQPQPQKEQLHQQQESPEQNATPVQLPSQIDDTVSEEEKERLTDEDSENVDASPTFWTACPYCLYMYEYPRVYAECTLRCSNCERAFQAVPVPSPPPITEDQEAYFCCWGSFPLGLSFSQLEKNNGKSTNQNWTTISPLYDVSSQVHDHVDHSAPAKQNRDRGARIYVDDFTEDIFTGISEPSDDSDLDWNGTNTKKVKKMKKRGRKRKSKLLAGKKTKKNLQNGTASSEEKPLVSNPRRQSGRVAKELGKLDLNVEFNNNEGEEPASKLSGGNRSQEKGEEDIIEGNGFFEGLDEFLSSLPILSVVNEEKVKG